MSVTLIETMGDDDRVVDAARVSFAKTAANFSNEQNHKLIRYLAKHKHFSPFGHCFASFKIDAPVFVRAQLVKHEYLRMNEVSRRYIDDEPEFYMPKKWRERAFDKKQGSGDREITHMPLRGFSVPLVTDSVWKLYDHALDLYNDMIEVGVAPEQARMVLPQAMMTSWYWSGSLDAFANMCNLRCYPDAQQETRVVAEEIDAMLYVAFPVSWPALRGKE